MNKFTNLKNTNFEQRKLQLQTTIFALKMNINKNFRNINSEIYTNLVNERVAYKYELSNLLKRKILFNKLQKIKNNL